METAKTLSNIPATTATIKNIQTPVVLSIDKVENAVDVFLSFQQVKHNTPSTYKRALRQFFGWVNRTGRVIGELTRADVLSFIREMESAELSPNTINSYLTAIRRFYAFTDLYGVFPNIAKEIKGARTNATSEHEKSDFTTTQAGDILTATQETGNKRDIAIMELMFRCGLRTIEVVRADIRDVELVGDVYTLKVHGKGDKFRRVPMTPKAWTALNDYLTTERKGAKDNEPLFTSNAHQCKGGRLATASVSRMAKKNIRAVGINDAKHTAHSCRHTALGAILEYSDDPAALTNAQILAGHSNPETTMVYVKQAATRRFMQNGPNLILDKLF